MLRQRTLLINSSKCFAKDSIPTTSSSKKVTITSQHILWGHCYCETKIKNKKFRAISLTIRNTVYPQWNTDKLNPVTYETWWSVSQKCKGRFKILKKISIILYVNIIHDKSHIIIPTCGKSILKIPTPFFENITRNRENSLSWEIYPKNTHC